MHLYIRESRAKEQIILTPHMPVRSNATSIPKIYDVNNRNAYEHHIATNFTDPQAVSGAFSENRLASAVTLKAMREYRGFVNPERGQLIEQLVESINKIDHKVEFYRLKFEELAITNDRRGIGVAQKRANRAEIKKVEEKLDFLRCVRAKFAEKLSKISDA